MECGNHHRFPHNEYSTTIDEVANSNRGKAELNAQFTSRPRPPGSPPTCARSALETADWPPAEAPDLQRERLTFLSGGAGVVLPGGLRIDLARRFPVNGDAPPDSKWRPWLSFGTAF